jgi:SAM-dependent methyltransferase
MKERFNVSFSNKLILDPACGSGRFLVAAFREKINEEKEGDIEKAYYSVVGLDILPLAVTLARAELMIAYYRATGKLPPGTPLIFWGDFLSSEIGLRAELVREFENISKALAIYTKQEIVDKLFKFEKYELLELLASLEYRLASILERLAYARRSGQVSTVINELRREVEMTRPINSIDNAVSLIIKRVLNDDILNQVLDLIDKYGNEIWAIPIVSNLFVDLLGKVKPDIVLTNPPWILLSQLPESEWGKKVRGIINNLINKYRSSISGISRTGMSGDISAIFLHVILKILEREGYVGIVMPASQSYWPNTPTYVGRLLTYAVLIDSGANVRGDSIFVGDVFGHGDLASVFIIKVSKRNK